MEEQPITAIVVLYYSKHLIAALLENITRRISNINEIILVDNSNEDLSDFENSMVKVIRPFHNIGYGAAINFGIKQASNGIIIALNPDIEITEWQLPSEITPSSRILASGTPNEWTAIRKFPSLTYDILRLSLQNLAHPFRWVSLLPGTISLNDIHVPILVDWISGALIITNQKTMAELGGFDEEFFLFFEEVDLCKRAALVGIPRKILPTISFNLNLGTSSSTNVSKIKFSSAIQSAHRYHSKFSGKTLTSIYFFFFKYFSFSIVTVLTTINRIKPNPKLQQKAEQYSVYAKASKLFHEKRNN